MIVESPAKARRCQRWLSSASLDDIPLSYAWSSGRPPISRFVVAHWTRIASASISFSFTFLVREGLGGGSISVEGGWGAADSGGTLVDPRKEHASGRPTVFTLSSVARVQIHD